MRIFFCVIVILVSILILAVSILKSDIRGIVISIGIGGSGILLAFIRGVVFSPKDQARIVVLICGVLWVFSAGFFLLERGRGIESSNDLIGFVNGGGNYGFLVVLGLIFLLVIISLFRRK